MYGFDSDCTEVISEFMHMYTSVNKVMEKNISKLERLKDMYSYEELITSFGIPKEEFGYRHTYFSDNYPFI